MNTNDYGQQPWVVNIEELTKQNDKFRVTKWSGAYLQMTVMTIAVGGEIGLEIHEGTDQFLRIEQGRAKVLMGKMKSNLDYEQEVTDDFAIFIPTNTWHNVINIGDTPIKLYSIYAPPHHAPGTIHETYEAALDAEANEEHSH